MSLCHLYFEETSSLHVEKLKANLDGISLDINDIEKINIECREFVEINIKDQKSLNEAINCINNCKNKPIVFGKIRREFKPWFDSIKEKILMNKVIVVDDDSIEIEDVDIESMNVKELLMSYAKNQKLDEHLVLNLYNTLVDNGNWKEILDNYYKTKF